MCWEDIQIARKSRVTQGGGLLRNGIASVAIPASKYRIALLISTDNGATVNFGLNKDVSMKNGFVYSPQGGPMVLNFRDSGQLVNQTLWGLSTGADVQFSYVETSLECETYEEFKRLMGY